MLGPICALRQVQPLCSLNVHPCPPANISPWDGFHHHAALGGLYQGLLPQGVPLLPGSHIQVFWCSKQRVFYYCLFFNRKFLTDIFPHVITTVFVQYKYINVSSRALYSHPATLLIHYWKLPLRNREIIAKLLMLTKLVKFKHGFRVFWIRITVDNSKKAAN